MRLRALAPLLALVVVACGSDDPSVTAEQAGRPVVITGLRPLAEAIEDVAGTAVVVIDLTPVGESAHELTLTDRQRREVLDADLAVVLGKGFQPDLERAAAARTGPTFDVLAALALPDRPDGAPGPVDHHVWLDPTIMGSIVTAVADAVAGVVPEEAAAVRGRAARLVEQHVRLDAQMQQGLRSCRLTVVASQHEAFGWLAARYELTNLGFDGPVPDEDPAPDPVRQAAIEERIDGGEVTTLFIGTLIPSGWLEALADERGLQVAVLNAYEGRTEREAADGATYRSIQLYNLLTLQDHLECEPT